MAAPRARSILIGAAAVLSLGLGLAAWGLHGRSAAGAPRAAGPPPNVILIVVDTLRADHLGAYGDPRGLTPFLDALAARGTVFAQAAAPSSWTCPSVASLFTAQLPSQHGVHGFASRLDDGARTVAEALAGAGYRTAGFTANFRLSQALGYHQGFERWGVFMPSPEETRPLARKVRAERLRAEAQRWVAEAGVAGSSRPTFLYFQFMEPHAPYDPPPAFRARFAAGLDDAASEALHGKLLKPLGAIKLLDAAELADLRRLYAAEVAAMDDGLRLLFDELGAAGLLEHALIVITADHGEEFGEHGHLQHGYTLYDGGIHVPLLLVGPGVPAGRVVRTPVSLIDVAPTLLALSGAPAEPTFAGHSLVPLLHADRPPPGWPPAVLSELHRAIQGPDFRAHERAARDEQFKVLVSPRGAVEVFDLAADPGEQAPLAGAAGVAVATRFAPLADPAPPAQAEAVALDDATKEKLRALGYHE